MPNQTTQRSNRRSPVENHLAELSELTKSNLRKHWQDIVGTSSPDQLRRDLMIPILAYRIQEKEFGVLNASSQKRLRQLAEGFARDPNLALPSRPTLKPGTRLVREWRDEVHRVNVEASGYEYKGDRYKSLSQIARQITGTRWSGPLFFGIKGGRARSTNANKEVQ